MNAADLYRKLADLGVVLTPHGEDGLTVDAPVGVIGPPLSSSLREVRSELRALALELSLGDYDWPLGDAFQQLPADHPLAVANEEHWANIEEGYYQYLTWPRVFPNPCLCCGGRYQHSAACEAMREDGLGVANSLRRH